MKKIIILAVFLLTCSLQAQVYLHGSVDTTKQSVITVYNTQESTTFTSLSKVFSRYMGAAIYCDSAVTVAYNSAMTKSIDIPARTWVFLGTYDVTKKPTFYFKKRYAETTAAGYYIILWDEVK